MRDAAMALERVDIIMHNTGNYWIVEGDISKCFDRIDHSILIKRLYHMGIKDRRVLQIIKAMLKAGVMEECAVNEEGTPQGGLISPLLANVYLDIMDEWSCTILSRIAGMPRGRFSDFPGLSIYTLRICWGSKYLNAR